VKESVKFRSQAESYSVSDAARLLGVSIPTAKRMAADGHVEGFRTPGGHLRIIAESIEALREQRRQPRPVREPSPVLQNRRERLEELTLEAQEHRARRELEKLRREEQKEADALEAEAQAREDEAVQREAEIELERERLELERAQQRARQEREQAEERAKREAQQALAAFRCRWQTKASEALSAYEYRWLSATQRKEMLGGLEAEIEKRQPADEPRMGTILAHSLEALVEPFRAERDAQERRQTLTEEALRSLPYLATEAEKVRATVAIREALRRLDSCADVCEMRVAVQAAVKPVHLAVGKRLLDARLLEWAIRELPWSRTDRDETRLRRECAEILAELPLGTSEAEGEEALEPTVREASAEIEKRQAENERQVRKASLIQQGLAEVSNYLLELKREGEIADEDYWDSDFTAHLNEAVRRDLEAELSGNETTKEVRELTREIIDGELD
jgi:excisionase family DNA binding protein